MKNKKKPQPKASKKAAPKKSAAKPAAKKAAPKKAPAKPAAKSGKPENRWVPEGCAWVNVYLAVKDVRKTIDFCVKAFGFKEGMTMPGPGGMIMHGEVTHEGQHIMMGPASPQWKTATPNELGGSSFTMYVYTKNVDKVYERAIAAGAKSMEAPQDKFYGDRTCSVEDLDGIRWGFATHLRDVSPAEMMKAMEAMGAEGGQGKKDSEHHHAHDHDAHASHSHTHEHEHGGSAHAHEHTHGHEQHGHGHEGSAHGHAHEHTHDHDHSHGGNNHGHSHEGHGHSHEGHGHGHEGHGHS